MRVIKPLITVLDGAKNHPLIGAAGVLGTIIGLVATGIDFKEKLSGPAKAQVVDTAAIEEVANNAAEKAARLTLKDSRNSMIPLHQATVSEPSIISGKKPRDVFPYITKLDDLTSYRFTFGDFVSQTTVKFFRDNEFNGWDNFTAPRDPLKSITATETSNTLGQDALIQLIAHFNGDKLSGYLLNLGLDVSPDTPVVISNVPKISKVSSDGKKLPNPVSLEQTPYGPEFRISLSSLGRWIESKDENGLPIVPKQLTGDHDSVKTPPDFKN
jgi:hypothetical protein